MVTVFPTRVHTPVATTVTGKPEDAVGLITKVEPYARGLEMAGKLMV